MDFNGIDVVYRKRFQQTLLYRSFNEHTCGNMVRLAQHKVGARTLYEDQEGPTSRHVGGRPILFKYQDLLLNALEIAPVPPEMKEQLEFALHYFDPDMSPSDLLDIYLRDPDKIGSFLTDFAPSEPLTLATLMLKAQSQHFSKWNLVDAIAGSQYLLLADGKAETLS